LRPKRAISACGGLFRDLRYDQTKPAITRDSSADARLSVVFTTAMLLTVRAAQVGRGSGVFGRTRPTYLSFEEEYSETQ
jgi:hypothetical protein